LGDPLEVLESTIDEADFRSCHEILNGAGHKDLSRARECRDPRADVYRDPCVVAASHLTFACVNTGPDIDAEIAGSVDNCSRAVDRASGAVEGHEKAVARSADLASIAPGKLGADESVVAVELFAPCAVTQFGDVFC